MAEKNMMDMTKPCTTPQDCEKMNKMMDSIMQKKPMDMKGGK